jgi:hypothetical protein
VFEGCTPLVTIPLDCTRIGDGAFRGCSSLASIAIPQNRMIRRDPDLLPRMNATRPASPTATVASMPLEPARVTIS